MAIINEGWTGTHFKRRTSASRWWIVRDVANKDEAARAVGITAGVSTHPWDVTLLAGEPQAEHESGPLTFKVTVDYQPASEAASSTAEVGAAPEFWWEKEYQTVAAEYDDAGNPLLMSGREMIEGLSDEILIPVLCFERMEAGFSPGIMRAFDNAFNADNVTLLGETYARGKILMQIDPIGRGKMANSTLPIAVRYRFKLLPPGVANWEYWRILDVGTTGRREDGSFGPLYAVAGSPEVQTQITTPVRLNGAGRPWDSSTNLVDGSAISQSGNPPDGASVEQTAAATFLRYKRPRRQPVNFYTLGLFV